MLTPNSKGFPSNSQTANICERLSNYKHDPFFDAHWSFDPEVRRKEIRAGRVSPRKKEKLALLVMLADLD